MIISYSEIKNIQLTSLVTIADDLNSLPGKEHYKLLAYLSHQYDNKIIIDIGTHYGTSALALSNNPNNTVYTFDICDKLSPKEKELLWYNNNVKFSSDNLWNDSKREQYKDIILQSSLIFLDIDPHGGKDEYEFYTWLKSNKYQGILILDDIHYFKDMRDNLWHHIPNEEKYDLTEFGHWSGTGLVTFKDIQIELYPKVQSRVPTVIHNKYSSEKSWTIVTAYFNLTKMQDASKLIKERDLEYYMQYSNMTMALDQNLVVYCDTESYEYLKKLRPLHLVNKTKYIITEFTQLNIVKQNYERVCDAYKIKRSIHPDPESRNTPSYYLLCMARYELLLDAMNNNYFNSTHFAWCNICIERMSWRNNIFFPKIWQEFRDKFSTCYIDYQPKVLVLNNINEYYRYGGPCSMCSGFFTGNKQYMTQFCNEITATFYEVLSLNLGHADEQLFSIVYFKRPELFEFYYGDYSEMIVNYGWIYDRPYEPIKNIMRNLYIYRENWPLLYDVTSRWLHSQSIGCFECDPQVIHTVKEYQKYAIKNM